jgi:hypothetical protein
MRYRSLLFTLLAAAAALAPCPAPAHDPGLSTMLITVLEEEIEVRITLTRAELAAALGSGAEKQPVQAIAVWADGEAVADTRSTVVGTDAVEVDLVARFARRRETRRLRLAVPLLGRLAMGHRQYVTATDGDGTVLAARLLAAADPELELELGRTASR